jgi:prepilin peptidase CpaA
MTSIAVSSCSVAATVIDLRTRRVPNALTSAAAAVGVGLALSGIGRVGVAASIVGGLLGLALMLPGYLFGGTGGGDVKLLAAIGTLLGPGRTVNAFIGAALAGGVIALAIAVRRGVFRTTLHRLARITRLDRVAPLEPPREATPGIVDVPRVDHTFAYAPAIAIGAVLAAIR